MLGEAVMMQLDKCTSRCQMWMAKVHSCCPSLKLLNPPNPTTPKVQSGVHYYWFCTIDLTKRISLMCTTYIVFYPYMQYCTCLLTSCTHTCACCSQLTGPTSWPTSSTLPGLTTECPSTPHHWSSLFRKWGRCTATAKHPWWCTAGEGSRSTALEYPCCI